MWFREQEGHEFIYILENSFENREELWYTWRLEDSINSPRTKVTDSCEPSHGCEELNVDLLQVW